MADNENFAQLSLAFVGEAQHRYKVIRPIVLLRNTSASQRSVQTGVTGGSFRKFV